MRWTLGLVCGLFLLRHVGLLEDNHRYLFHDNLGYHFPSFVYFANSLAHGFGFPRLLMEWGGSDVGITSISMSYFAPHRWIGYLLYVATGLSPLFVFKFMLLAGVVLNAFGWFLFWKRLLKSTDYAVFGTLIFLFSGIGLTVLHHEQMLATISWIPWTLYFGLRAYEEQRFLPLAMAFCGSLFTLHYPQIHLIALSALVALLMAFFGRDRLGYLKVLSARRSTWIGALVFLMAAAPCLYVVKNINSYGSPVRGTRDLKITSLHDYLQVNRQQISSAPAKYYANLFRPSHSRGDDQMAFFITRVGIWLAVIGAIGVLLYERRWIVLFPFLAVCFWATLGINGGLAQLLFVLRIPTVAEFRQWYHFLPYVLLTLITFSCLGLKFSNDFLKSRNIPLSVRRLAYAVLVVLAVSESNQLYRKYVEKYHIHDAYEVPRYSREAFLTLLNGKWMHEVLPIPYSTTLIAKKTSIDFLKDCPASQKFAVWSCPSKSEAVDCDFLAAGKRLESPEATFDPQGVSFRLQPDTSSCVITSVNPDFVEDDGGRIQGVASGAMTRAELAAMPRLNFKSSGFYWALLIQLFAFLLSVFYLAWGRLRR